MSTGIYSKYEFDMLCFLHMAVQSLPLYLKLAGSSTLFRTGWIEAIVVSISGQHF